jgi:hypothetical protein
MVAIRNALDAAISGLQRSEADVARAAHAVNTAAAVNADAVNRAAAPTPPSDTVEVSDAASVADAVRGAVIPPGGDGDLAKPLIDLLQAKVAYQANLASVKVTSDVEDDTTRLLTRHA